MKSKNRRHLLTDIIILRKAGDAQSKLLKKLFFFLPRMKPVPLFAETPSNYAGVNTACVRVRA